MRGLGESRGALARVRLLLSRDPGADVAWYWRIRDRVLSYVVTRYSTPEDRTCEEPTGAPTPSSSSERGIRHLVADDVRSTAPSGVEVEPEVLDEMRAHLHGIAAANRQVDKTPPAVVLPRVWEPVAGGERATASRPAPVTAAMTPPTAPGPLPTPWLRALMPLILAGALVALVASVGYYAAFVGQLGPLEPHQRVWFAADACLRLVMWASLALALRRHLFRRPPPRAFYWSWLAAYLLWCSTATVVAVLIQGVLPPAALLVSISAIQGPAFQLAALAVSVVWILWPLMLVILVAAHPVTRDK